MVCSPMSLLVNLPSADWKNTSFSEEALIKYRVLVEVEYFIALREADLPQLAKIDKSIYDSLRAIYKNFSTEDALWIKEKKKTTNM